MQQMHAYDMMTNYETFKMTKISLKVSKKMAILIVSGMMAITDMPYLICFIVVKATSLTRIARQIIRSRAKWRQR